jgi:hypothetical protein
MRMKGQGEQEMADHRSVLRILAVATPFWLLSGCADTDGAGIQTASVPPLTAVPADYRQILARNVLAKVHPKKILNAQISPPGLWVGPLGLGGPRPTACVKWTAEGQYGQESHNIGYTFSQGHIDEILGFDPMSSGGLVPAMAKHAYTCGKLSYGPFPEVMKR